MDEDLGPIIMMDDGQRPWSAEVATNLGRKPKYNIPVSVPVGTMGGPPSVAMVQSLTPEKSPTTKSKKAEWASNCAKGVDFVRESPAPMVSADPVSRGPVALIQGYHAERHPVFGERE